MNTRRACYYEYVLIIYLLLQMLTADAFISQPQNSPRPTFSSRRIPELQAVAKSGGRMIETEEQYNNIVLAEKNSKPVLVFFSAPWCGPCRLTNPVVKEVMKQYAGQIDVVEVCTDDLAEISEQAGIMSIPTIQFYYSGQALDTIVGCVAKSVLANAVDKVLEDVQQLQQQRKTP